ncbi:MAG: ABC-2 family transporter protein [Candidatus Methanofastidiosum methylothiophilum]|uniref:ABC-2 family transporter protein n=1 Tax=Candidatus Methanofastidiosum methylothiophilum TaxID=1705564 RepID=A0A150ILN1_9EURY|nr:MAG: ABC-2 family transporter protein [Candidatus Methanofastidiosum methylthiophilus]KYC48357.1 MAG: ABC-2 family transporter protein [Candidatus Methanofastidiosum methylthiophilus]KYC50778.1 MAG: ABC-2 family transporter protein [Candidatus Methanofastidiosum methylthiophilus]
MASKTKVVAITEFMTSVKRKEFIILTFLLPLILVMSMVIPLFFMQTISHQKETLGVVDESGIVLPILKERYTDYIIKEVPSPEEARQLLENNIISNYIVIPKDFLKVGKASYYSKVQLSSFSSANINLERILSDIVIESLLSDKGVSKETINKVKSPIEMERITVTKKGEEVETPFSFVGNYLLPLFLFMSIMNAGGYLLNGIIEEKENKVVEVLLSTISPNELLSGKILGLGGLGILQVGIWISGIVIITSFLKIPLVSFEKGIIIMIFFILGYLFYSSIFAMIGSISTSTRDSQQISAVVSFLVFIPLLLFFGIVQNPNMAFIRLLGMVPPFIPTIMMMRVLLSEVPIIDIVLSMLILSLSLIVSAKIASKIFKVGILMHGKKPSLSEVLRWVRG